MMRLTLIQKLHTHRLRNLATTMEEILCTRICHMGGGKFMGIQKAVPEVGLKALCLFEDLEGSTLAIPVCELTAQRVRYELEMSKLRFNGWSEADLKDATKFLSVLAGNADRVRP